MNTSVLLVVLAVGVLTKYALIGALTLLPAAATVAFLMALTRHEDERRPTALPPAEVAYRGGRHRRTRCAA